jgi:hypothetical protein
VLTPKQGSWFNLVEGCFAKMARSIRRHIRDAAKVELKARLKILIHPRDLDRDHVIHTWRCKIGEAA